MSNDLLDAPVPTESVISLAQQLIRIPSQAGIDSSSHILEFLEDWLKVRFNGIRMLPDGTGNAVAILADVGARPEAPKYCLNACVDTAPFGDRSAWQRDPASGDIVEGWLHGRGSADCKIAVALFAHLAVEFAAHVGEMKCGLAVLFDADEHTGRFGGIRQYASSEPDLAGVMIGYPGNYGVVTGARGFCRIHITTYATASHSGSAKAPAVNAVLKAARIVESLSVVSLPSEMDPDFPFGPKLSVTGIKGGNGYTVTPDQCDIHVDIRLTPSFDRGTAVALVRKVVAEVDVQWSTWKATSLEVTETWPAYKLPETSPLVSALRTAAATWTERDVPAVTCGPSNVGNYLASLGIEATCGYGVTYKNLHAPNECVELSTVEMVYQVYRQAIALLCQLPCSDRADSLSRR